MTEMRQKGARARAKLVGMRAGPVGEDAGPRVAALERAFEAERGSRERLE